MTKPITHASLFSGIGGPEVAAAMLGWHNAFHCEINPFGRRVLEYWFPQSKSYEDITQTDFTPWRGQINVLTGGFPCQPFSYAGKRGGREDERYLWPQMLRAIDEIRPTWVIGENVAGITTMVEGGVLTDLGRSATLFDAEDDVHGYELRESFTIERICQDLERIGYAVQPMLIPAAAVGAPHRRDRVFIVAYASDAYGSNDLRSAGEDEGEGGEERLQERNEVRLPGEPDKVRPGVQRLTENTLRSGQLFGQSAEQGGEWVERYAGSRNTERVCGEKRADIADTYGGGGGKVQTEIHSGVADGDVPLCNGSKRATAYANGKGLQEPKQPGRAKAYQKEGAGLDDRAERPCSHEDITNAFCERLSAAIQRGFYGEEEWDDEGRPAEFYTHDAWIKGTWWDNFPTVSPVHTRDDGLSQIMDGTALGFTKCRTESLKAYGNAIVPQVMYEIFLAIDKIENEHLS